MTSSSMLTVLYTFPINPKPGKQPNWEVVTKPPSAVVAMWSWSMDVCAIWGNFFEKFFQCFLKWKENMKETIKKQLSPRPPTLLLRWLCWRALATSFLSTTNGRETCLLPLAWSSAHLGLKTFWQERSERISISREQVCKMYAYVYIT